MTSLMVLILLLSLVFFGWAVAPLALPEKKHSAPRQLGRPVSKASLCRPWKGRRAGLASPVSMAA